MRSKGKKILLAITIVIVIIGAWATYMYIDLSSYATSHAYGRQYMEIESFARILHHYLDRDTQNIYRVALSCSLHECVSVVSQVSDLSTFLSTHCPHIIKGRDFWGHPWIFELNVSGQSMHLCLRSLGKNGVDNFGQKDDIQIKYVYQIVKREDGTTSILMDRE